MVDDSSVREYEALITIMDYELRDDLAELFDKSHMPVTFLTHGHGTAKSKIYEILGYGGRKKIVSVSVQTKKLSNYILDQIQNKINLNKPGTGIAFTMSLSSISKALSMTIEKTEENLKIGSEGMGIKTKESYHLIVTIVNTGYFDQVMEAAKSVGATGGTVIHGRGLGSEEAVKYLGITIQPEKDVVLILTEQEKRHAIMENITREAGLNTKGKGICFSLPVNEAIGLNTGISNIDEL